jgi:hypothetical protein
MSYTPDPLRHVALYRLDLIVARNLREDRDPETVIREHFPAATSLTVGRADLFWDFLAPVGGTHPEYFTLVNEHPNVLGDAIAADVKALLRAVADEVLPGEYVCDAAPSGLAAAAEAMLGRIDAAKRGT